MARLEWLRKAFENGYDSGDILAEVPSSMRLRQEVIIGGSYRKTFYRAILPFLRPDSSVLEIGPGRGSWSRAILAYLPDGELTSLDFIDVRQWINPTEFNGRFVFHQVQDFSFSSVPEDYFDFFWSFGVLCHHTIEQICGILANSRPKMRKGGVAVHEYGHWDKMFQSGRMVSFPQLIEEPDEKSWWPSNSPEAMEAAAREAGWICIEPDLDLFTRDGIILLKAW